MRAGSCSVAISRSRPPQCGHARTSIENARCIKATRLQAREPFIPAASERKSTPLTAAEAYLLLHADGRAARDGIEIVGVEQPFDVPLIFPFAPSVPAASGGAKAVGSDARRPYATVIGRLIAENVVKMAFGGSQVTRERESGALISLGDDLKAAATDARAPQLHQPQDDNPAGDACHVFVSPVPSTL